MRPGSFIHWLKYYTLISVAGFTMTLNSNDREVITEIHWVRYSSRGAMADLHLHRLKGNRWSVQDALKKAHWQQDVSSDIFTQDELKTLWKTAGTIHSGQDDYAITITKSMRSGDYSKMTLTFSRQARFFWIIERMAVVEATVFSSGDERP